MYSHLLVLLTKTALTYVQPLQAVFQHSSLAQVVQFKWFSARHGYTRLHGHGFDPACANNFYECFLFLQFSFYCNMQLIQFNVYFNHHIHIFMLGYITY